MRWQYGTFKQSPLDPPTDHVFGSATSAQSDSQRQKRFESDNSFLSRLFFVHVRYLVARQKQRQLCLDDFWSLEAQSTSRVVSERLLWFCQRNDGNLLLAILQMEWQALLASGLLVLLAIPCKLAPALLVFLLLQRLEGHHVDAWQVVAFLAAVHFARVCCTLFKGHAELLTTRMAGRVMASCHVVVLQVTLTDASVVEKAGVSYTYSGVIETLGTSIVACHRYWSAGIEIAGEVYVASRVINIDSRIVGGFIGGIVLLILISVVLKSHLKRKSRRRRTKRWGVVNECFRAIRSVKVNAWEEKFQERIQAARDEESKSILWYSWIDAFSRGVAWCGDEFIVGLVLLYVLWQGLGFYPAVAFSSLIVVQLMKTTISVLLRSSGQVVDGYQALKSLRKYFRRANALDDRRANAQSSTQRELNASEVISIVSSGFGRHRSTSDYVLMNVNLVIKRGELALVHGQAGEGKTTLLKAMLGEVPSLHGEVLVSAKDRIAYCSQEPWVQALTIRENILFGSPYDETKYLAVLDACALIDDLQRLPKGDETLVGSRGINLSGGQKARLALARACYTDADLYILDCPLASVDAVVQMEVFRKCVVELLRYKTVVMVTHNVEFIHSLMVDRLVEVREHSVTVKSFDGSTGASDVRSKRLQAYEPSYGFVSSRAKKSIGQSSRGLIYDARHCESLRLELCRNSASKVTTSGSNTVQTADGALDKLQVLFPGKRRGVWLAVVAGLGVVIFETCLVFKNFWLAWWSSQTSYQIQSSMDNVLVYEGSVGGAFVALLFNELFVLYSVKDAVNGIFRGMISGLLYAPLSFYYRNRIGEFLRQVKSNMDFCDFDVSIVMVSLFRSVVLVVGALCVLSYLLGFVGVAIAVMVIFIGLQMKSIDVFVRSQLMSVEIESMDMGDLLEALEGIPVIRAFGKSTVDRFVSAHGSCIDNMTRLRLATVCLRNSEKMYMSRMHGLFMAALAFVLITSDTHPALLGLSVIYITSLHNDTVAFLASCISGIVIIQSVNLRASVCIPPEEQFTAFNRTVGTPNTWIAHGKIVFDRVWFRYDPSCYALRDVSFTIEPGSKIGVVGRTGSGKSSLAMALLRVHELVQGRILVDSVDIRSLPLKSLRSSMSVILQSPMFYRCTVREYLDPFDEFADNDLWQVIHKTGLSPFVQTLQTELHENGENWSLGQRQLLCLARSLLRPSKIVILDEPFSSIDGESDKQLLSVLSSELRESTVLFVTHRLDQVLTFCEKILVLKDGEVEDFGVVEELVGRSDGVFFELLETTLLTP